MSRFAQREGIPAHRLETRIEQGRELRGLYRELGHTRTSIAKFLRVTPRTLFNWETGRTAIPVATLKLLRLLRRSELPGKEWQGWSFSRGTLWSPEGHGFKAADFAWLSATIRRARLFGVLYREREQLRVELVRAHVQAAQARATALTVQAHAGLLELAALGELPAGSDKRDVPVTRPVCFMGERDSTSSTRIGVPS